MEQLSNAELDEMLRQANEDLLAAIRRDLGDALPPELAEVGFINFALREDAPDPLIEAVYQKAGSDRIQQVLRLGGPFAVRLATALLKIEVTLDRETLDLARALANPPAE